MKTLKELIGEIGQKRKQSCLGKMKRAMKAPSRLNVLKWFAETLQTNTLNRKNLKGIFFSKKYSKAELNVQKDTQNSGEQQWIRLWNIGLNRIAETKVLIGVSQKVWF